MFQTFDVKSDADAGPRRVADLRVWLTENGLDGFLVPRSDEHQGEYVAARSERLRWLTGFTGSAGAALIMRERALIFVDGRYQLQVRSEVDMRLFSVESLIDNPPAAWISENLGKGARIGFDPWLHTVGDVKALREACEKVGATLVALERNPIDILWTNQPSPPLAPVAIHPNALAGQLAKDKLVQLASSITLDGATHAVITDPSSIAWAFNIRGNDVPHTPLALGFAILAAEGLHRLFMDKRKLGRETEAYLTQLADLHAPSELDDALVAIAKAGGRVALDPALAAERLRMVVEDNGGTVVSATDPARLPRATKNNAELAGARSAHRRDAVAVIKLLAWLDQQPAGSLDEISVVTRLEKSRASVGEEAQMPLRDVSFDTIAGAGPNGAIMHYRVSQQTNRKIEDGTLFLLDSGAQYQDGTTDITRTMAVGRPSDEMRQRFTMVLKGLIAISTLRFPAGTRGMDIDAFARVAHWKSGCDFAHGTGHGVGSYLSVHEGPQRIAKTGTEKLLEGMILSNEPGYYKEGEYGIRLENLIVVTPAELIGGGDIAMHRFETLTLVPIDRRLIVTVLINEEERAWLNDYHARVADEITPMLGGAELAWLEAATAPL
ncbi:M24 family metallopeptidase [Mesorhizobium sp. NBSH29]|uniref:aminopeptidase P family protein n=1 Tax=Mesorhizobium sp. NBSH29 TaxID=2654249 RepID=UPI0018969047|nr:aminopeptidase P family protein [Mesorhizobium sp. NBSH29]QPC88189.1 M24 family metallopeptidase [Mesorhizobium sp. NBSH29]